MSLKEKIFDAGYNKEQLAELVGIPLKEFEEKIENLGLFSCDELDRICNKLNISSSEVATMFF